MTHDAFDKALIASALDLAAGRGWAQVTVADAARAAGLKLGEARLRFPGRGALLVGLGRIADAAALAGTDGPQDSTARDRLFDIVMRRIDVFQAHRAGVLALFKALPADPLLALMLWGATVRSMAWLLDGAGLSSTGLDRAVRAHALAVLWVAVIRAWISDESADLSATMAALDRALDRAEQMSGWLPQRGSTAPSEDIAAEPFEDPAPTTAEPLPQTAPPPPPDTPASPPV